MYYALLCWYILFIGSPCFEQERLKGKGPLSTLLKQEFEFLDTVSLDDDVIWMRSALADMLQVWQVREVAVEEALEKCQINVQISDDSEWL